MFPSPESHNQNPGWHVTPSLLPMLPMVSIPQPTPHPSLGWSGDLPDNDCNTCATVSGDQVLLVGFNFTQVTLMAFGLTSLVKGSHAHVCMYKGCLVPPLPQWKTCPMTVAFSSCASINFPCLLNFQQP